MNDSTKRVYLSLLRNSLTIIDEEIDSLESVLNEKTIHSHFYEYRELQRRRSSIKKEIKKIRRQLNISKKNLHVTVPT